MKYDYTNRISYLIELQSQSQCEILDDAQEDQARSILLHLDKTDLQLLIIIPKDSTNVNDIVFFGVDRGKTLNAIEEGFSDEEITNNIDNMIELEDETNAVNFICGQSFFRKNEKCIQRIDEILEKMA